MIVAAGMLFLWLVTLADATLKSNNTYVVTTSN
jgi:hypothetical protein